MSKTKTLRTVYHHWITLVANGTEHTLYGVSPQPARNVEQCDPFWRDQLVKLGYPKDVTFVVLAGACNVSSKQLCSIMAQNAKYPECAVTIIA